ncbi:hypothetical protein SAMN06265222_116108 [Neorhodopirellula lusitana]|uniref:NHL repeat containing protein n=1 Tax=Neorhodopirellula lusitana TaxID=445327 RepID=A0ABY1QLV0_9BACT|nr:hypothetical protein [Neorhodopirellula lusitana]SMP73381.1 hypothetical protein SAMN06265222_116108 [Neorhodopirellula lusitana]
MRKMVCLIAAFHCLAWPLPSPAADSLPLISSDEKVLLSEAFDEAPNGWSLTGAAVKDGELGPKTAVDDNAMTAGYTFNGLNRPDLTKGPVRVYYRVRCSESKGGYNARVGIKVFAAEGNSSYQLLAQDVWPGEGAHLQGRFKKGSLAPVMELHAKAGRPLQDATVTYAVECTVDPDDTAIMSTKLLIYDPRRAEYRSIAELGGKGGATADDERLFKAGEGGFTSIELFNRNRDGAGYFDAVCVTQGGGGAMAAGSPAGSIPITFSLEKPGYVTLVIDDAEGHRVRNLISEKPFEAGTHRVDWDGNSDTGRLETEIPRVYEVVPEIVAPGEYQVRGLVRPEIKLEYEFTVYDRGNPPWQTKSPASGWLGDHEPPQSVLWVDQQEPMIAGQPVQKDGMVLIGSPVVEGGHGLVWTDLTGKKLYGQKWVEGVWTGATYLASDTSSNAVEGVTAYSASAWEGGGYDGEKPELRLSEILAPASKASAPRDVRFGSGMTRPLLKPHAPYSGALSGKQSRSSEDADFRFTFPSNDEVGLSGLAVDDGLLVAALPKLNQLIFVDARARKVLGVAEVPTPGAIVFNKNGQLLMIDTTTATVVRYDVSSVRQAPPGSGTLSLPEPEVVIAEGLEEPQQLAFDKRGQIYVSDWGSCHQVKVFDAVGTLVHTIGRAGEPSVGAYDSNHMNHPSGVTFDSKGRLWVAEFDQRPKRISKWTTEGKLVDAFYGPGRYSGGGTLDPNKRNLYYDGMRFKLDWQKRRGTPDAVTFREELDAMKLPMGSHQRPPAPERPIHIQGRTYFTNAYTTTPTGGPKITAVWRLEDGKAVPAAFIGQVYPWTIKNPDKVKAAWSLFDDTFKSRLPSGSGFEQDKLTAYWFDANGDGQVQPDETTMRLSGEKSTTVGDGLGLTTGQGTHYAVKSFTGVGVPVYDFDHPETLVKRTRVPNTSGGGQVFAAKDGWTILTVPPEPFDKQASLSGAQHGVPMWSYPSLWPGLHPSHHAPLPQYPGQLIGTTRMLGPSFTPKGEAGEMWAQNSDKSNVYLMTTDGLFVATLFSDSRTGDWTFEEDRSGIDVSNASTGQESFYPTVTQTDDGETFLVVGARSGASIVQVKGLEDIRRLPPQTLEVTASQLKGVLAASGSTDDRAAGRLVVKRVKDRDVQIDGQLIDWANNQWVKIDERASASLAITSDKLVIAYRTDAPKLTTNNAENLAQLFTGGGGLDLMLATNPGADPNRSQPVAGDLRLLVAEVSGRVTAVLYRPVVDRPMPGDQPITFRSPVGNLRFEAYREVSSDVTLASDGKGNFEVAVPLATLGIEHGIAGNTLGDLGVIRGNGFKTQERSYWSNTAAAITSDVPSEAQLLPAHWGQVLFPTEP